MKKLSRKESFFRLQKAGERVGVFDSGVGGLTVLAACMRRLPSQKFFYYGDNTHAPYGSRPPEEVEKSNPELKFPVGAGERIFVYRRKC